MIPTNAVRGALSALKDFLLSREESGRENMGLYVLTKAVQRALSCLDAVFSFGCTDVSGFFY